MNQETDPTTDTSEEEPAQPSWQEGNEENLRRREAETRRRQKEEQEDK